MKKRNFHKFACLVKSNGILPKQVISIAAYPEIKKNINHMSHVRPFISTRELQSRDHFVQVMMVKYIKEKGKGGRGNKEPLEFSYSNSTPCCCCLSCRARARSARRRRRLLAYDPLASVPVHVGEVTLPAP